MKIGITTFGCDGGKSGISQYLINLLREFSSFDDKHKFEALTYEKEKDIFIPERSHISPLCFGDKFQHPVLNIAWHQTALPRLCKKRKYDVLFLPAANRRLPLRMPCPTVGTAHDFSSLHVKKKYDSARIFYISKVLPFLIRRLTKIITVSESSKRDIVKYCDVPSERVSVIPLAANSNMFFPSDNRKAVEAIASKYNFRTPYILFISRIEHPGKNHARLIKAFSILKREVKLPHQLVLAGGKWFQAEEVYQEAEKSEFSSDIVFTGFVPDEDLPDLYRGSDAFIFPSLYEGFGLPVLEAMSCGVPVACSNISSMPEVAGEAALVFDPYNEEAIADSMKRLLTNKKLSDSLVGKGLERSSKFNWSSTALKTLKVIESAVNDYQ